jgi:hypothetical protein
VPIPSFSREYWTPTIHNFLSYATPILGATWESDCPIQGNGTKMRTCEGVNCVFVADLWVESLGMSPISGVGDQSLRIRRTLILNSDKITTVLCRSPKIHSWIWTLSQEKWYEHWPTKFGVGVGAGPALCLWRKEVKVAVNGLTSIPNWCIQFIFAPINPDIIQGKSRNRQHICNKHSSDGLLVYEHFLKYFPICSQAGPTILDLYLKQTFVIIMMKKIIFQYMHVHFDGD